MSELISIIIPVYKVEKYIRRCIDSVINQTYSNLEIILIDDGSPDKCPLICDEYAKKDARIRVIHKENGGISSARNVGINIAKGRYIGFVDSDDYINENMYQQLHKDITENKVDISICSFQKITESEAKNVGRENNNIKIYNKKEALKALLTNELTSHPWNKLYKKELFDNIRYPEGKVMEDLATTYLLFEASNNICYRETEYYYYVQRDTSILHSITPKFIEQLEEVIAFKSQYMNSKYPELTKYVEIELLNYIKIFYDDIMIANAKNLWNSKKYKDYGKKYKELYKKYKNELLKRQVNTIKRYECKLLYISRNIYYIYYKSKQIMKKIKEAAKK